MNEFCFVRRIDGIGVDGVDIDNDLRAFLQTLRRFDGTAFVSKQDRHRHDGQKPAEENAFERAANPAEPRLFGDVSPHQNQPLPKRMTNGETNAAHSFLILARSGVMQMRHATSQGSWGSRFGATPCLRIPMRHSPGN